MKIFTNDPNKVKFSEVGLGQVVRQLRYPELWLVSHNVRNKDGNISSNAVSLHDGRAGYFCPEEFVIVIEGAFVEGYDSNV